MFTSLRLERFKNFQDAELKLVPFTVLIGGNASGKSNIRDAFRFLHGIARGYSLAEIIGEKYGEGGERVWTGIRGGTPEICFAGARSFALTLESLISFPSPMGAQPPFSNGQADEKYPFKYRLEARIGNHRAIPSVAEERFWDGHSRDQLVGAVKNHELQVYQILADGREFPVVPSPVDRPFVHRLAHSIGTSVKSEFYTQNVNTQIHLHEWCTKLARTRFFDWSIDAIRQPSHPGQDALSDNGRNLSSVLYAICQDEQGKRNLLSWIDELTPMDPVDFEFPTDPTGRVLATLVERNKQKITLASASDGTLRFLAFLAAFLGPHPSSFLFFEELENGVHPTRLSLLLDLVENQVKNKNIQVVATTHSPQLLGRMSKDSLENASLIYRLDKEPDARIIRVIDMPDAKRLIRKYRAADLLASGWFEDTAHYMQPEPANEPSPQPVRRKSRARA
jgi:predicted ATPase